MKSYLISTKDRSGKRADITVQEDALGYAAHLFRSGRFVRIAITDESGDCWVWKP